MILTRTGRRMRSLRGKKQRWSFPAGWWRRGGGKRKLLRWPGSKAELAAKEQAERDARIARGEICRAEEERKTMEAQARA